MRIAVLGPSRFGLGEPHCGGLESHTATLARGLHELGHHVVVFAGPRDAAHQLPVEVVPIIERPLPATTTARLDTSTPAWFARHETHGYLDALDRVAAEFDVVHNNSLHASVVDAELAAGFPPVVHVLHCPPFRLLEQAHRRLHQQRARRCVVAVSDNLASAWGEIPTDTVHNGVDVDVWRPVSATTLRASTGRCVWAGRIVAEKSPHLAIDAANSLGWQLTLAGPVQDQDYFDTEIAPRLSVDITWLGALDARQLRRLYANSNVGVLTPTWEEPFGLVAAEMLSCGLPIAALDRGAIGEFTDPSVAVLTPGDSGQLAGAIRTAARLDRVACRRFAVATLSLSVMLQRYIGLYQLLTTSRSDASPIPLPTATPPAATVRQSRRSSIDSVLRPQTSDRCQSN